MLIKITDKKRFAIFVAAAFLVIIGSVAVWKYYKFNKENPHAVWEAMIVLRSQTLSDDPVEDAKGALKRGDAISVREPGHEWSETEYKSYLLVKIEGRKNEVEKLLEPETAENNADKNADGTPKEIVRARRYAADMEVIGFDGDQVVAGQPVEDKIYSTEIIIEK